MKRRLCLRTLPWALLYAAAAVLAPGAADAAATPSLPAHAAATAPPAVELIAKDGFGDERNVYSWSMERFRGKIYVGTGRMVACVENLTADFYLVVSGKYVEQPYPGAYCPPDPYDMDLRAEIWEYDLRTRRWRLAYRSPADIPNPRAPGKFMARDIAFRGMTVFRDGRGRKRLYIGGVTADEYLPELKRKHPPRILSTVDGRRFRVTPARDVIVRMPYGTRRYRPIGFRSMRVWQGRMYVNLTPGLQGDGAVFEVTRPWSPRRVRFRQISPKSIAVFETEVFNGHLYAGTGSYDDGYGVYKVTRTGSRFRFDPVMPSGAGRGSDLTSVVTMKAFKGHLYVGSSGWWDDSLPVSELIRINRSGRWQVVAGNTRVVDGVVKLPISGLRDGFNSMFAAHFWRLGIYRGALAVGTNDWSFLVRTAYDDLLPWEMAVVESVIKPEAGFDVWSSCDGEDWAPITRDAFGGNASDFGARNLVSAGSSLFIGSANHGEGTKVWRYRGPACAAPTATAARAQPAAPRRLMTDVQAGGTVVSWERPAAQPPATRYRVLRADYEHVSLGVGVSPRQPNGLHPPGQLPSISAAGTAGTRTLDVPVMARFTTVGTTRSPVFVDRTARPGEHYAYQIEAESPSGAGSARSNVQVVPDPRPAPGLRQVARAAGGAPLPATATLAASASSRHARATTLRALAQLEQRQSADPDLRDLIERVQRRVRYAGLATRTK